ncbi:MAG: hypothetical protein CMN30_12270 [Sandaracinus sp.]|nr:hypothetical protein [Sandaracinus sp.]
MPHDNQPRLDLFSAPTIINPVSISPELINPVSILFELGVATHRSVWAVTADLCEGTIRPEGAEIEP